MSILTTFNEDKGHGIPFAAKYRTPFQNSVNFSSNTMAYNLQTLIDSRIKTGQAAQYRASANSSHRGGVERCAEFVDCSVRQPPPAVGNDDRR